MEFKSGDRVQVESESTERPPRTGVVEEVVQGTAYPRVPGDHDARRLLVPGTHAESGWRRSDATITAG